MQIGQRVELGDGVVDKFWPTLLMTTTVMMMIDRILYDQIRSIGSSDTRMRDVILTWREADMNIYIYLLRTELCGSQLENDRIYIQFYLSIEHINTHTDICMYILIVTCRQLQILPLQLIGQAAIPASQTATPSHDGAAAKVGCYYYYHYYHQYYYYYQYQYQYQYYCYYQY